MGYMAMQEWYVNSSVVGTSFINLTDPRTLATSAKVPSSGKLVQVRIKVTGPATSLDYELWWDYGGANPLKIAEGSGLSTARQVIFSGAYHWALAGESICDNLTLRVLTDDGTASTEVDAWFGIEAAEPNPTVHVIQPWNDVRVFWSPSLSPEVDFITGETIEAKVWRISDGKSLQSDNTWASTNPDALSMTLQTSYFPRYAYLDLPLATLDRDLGSQGYYVEITHERYNQVISYYIDTIVPPWSYTLGDFTAAGTFGDALNRILGLKNHNTRWVPSAWDSANRPTAGVIHAYDSASNYDADSSPYSGDKRYAVTATYDGDGKLTLYGCRLEA